MKAERRPWGRRPVGGDPTTEAGTNRLTSLPSLPATGEVPPHPHLPGRPCTCRQLAAAGGGRRG